ncbi:hypothetical protein QNA08_00410 [Chelatococcus sp. SYSU_G07232]|uniref:Lectin-like protein BA14k n=1 Tax=Chelatococcus albus TaxID=3047466 RepID=A0ABT7ABH2_9HYPH|nr:hypothetical protein [Chelatococcus sp. SYSU_G07232]MDJ1156711.1 hypothetical protein [Chelatococcus sp. SYSU_G07232]
MAPVSKQENARQDHPARLRSLAKTGLLCLALISGNDATAAAVPSGPGTPADVGTTASSMRSARVGVRPGGPVMRPPAAVARPVRPPAAVGRPVGRVYRPGAVVVRPVPRVRPWYWGAAVAGVTVGAITAVAVAGAAPAPPDPSLCWFWTDNSRARGYWDYCTPPTR